MDLFDWPSLDVVCCATLKACLCYTTLNGGIYMEVNELLKIAVTNKASDLHVLPGSIPLLRIDGVLAPIKQARKLSPAETESLLRGLLTPAEQKKFDEQRVVELAYSTPDGHFRCSIFHQMHGVAGVFRIVPEVVPTLDELSLPAILKKLLVKSKGLILAAGPTGSGKSTTLAAMVDYINTYRICNIFTIEDPIEFVHTNKRSIFNQIQIGRDAVDYATALRSSLRQDPNVIMLGELRDLETMRLALTAVETGHLVLATIHAASASLALSRFGDVFPTEEKNQVRTLLSETIEAVICQRLVKKKSGGRAAAFEIMLATPAVRHYIRQDMPAHIESAMQTSGDKGMVTFDFTLEKMVKQNIITNLVADALLDEIKSFSDNELRKKTET